MLVPKEIIPGPGDYWYKDQDTGQPKKLTVTAQDIQYWHDSGNEMLSAGLSIPVPQEHQPNRKPLTPAEKAAQQLRDNAGWANKYELKNGGLWSVLDIQDEEFAKKLPKTVRYTSPWITSFVDGNGKQWDGVIGHIALTTRPRIVPQKPFQQLNEAISGIAAGLSLANIPPASFEAKKVPTGGSGILLSPVGYAVGGKPKYPRAFSIFLAEPPFKKKEEKDPPEEEGKDKPPKKEGKTEEPPEEEGEEYEMEDAEPVVGEEGDISVYEVIADLLEIAIPGFQMAEGRDKETFCNSLYEAIMAHVKGNGNPPEEPMNTPAPKPGEKPNPIIQEQPPLFMSLEDAQKITDPSVRQIALSLVQQQKQTESLRKRALSEAKVKRDQRIERLSRILPQAQRDQLVAHANGIQFALGDDGIVTDPMQVTLDLLDAAQKNIPDLLQNPVGIKELDHPTEFSGAMSEARRTAVVAELSQNAGLPVAKAS